MKRYVLDTSILLHYIRESKLSLQIEEHIHIMSRESVPLIASVTVGELEGFMQRQNWGEKKITQLKRVLSKVLVVDITGHDKKLMKSYATLWNYSKNALPENKLGKSIGIGQNDVWIAALTKTSGAELVTTDGDFDHLNGSWITVHKF